MSSNPKLDRRDLGVLESIRNQLEELDVNWQEMNAYCLTFPRTLVHGDLLCQNMRIRSNGQVSVAVLFDWERSGWGIPALDLTRFLGSRLNPDLRAYLSVLQSYQISMDAKGIRRLAYVGEIFRWLDAVRWETENLQWEWIDGPMHRMRIYKQWMDDISRAAPWIDNPALAAGH